MNPPNNPTKCIFYSRVSTDHQTDNTSLDDQVSRGKAYALSQNWALDKVFVESGESGKSTDRREFQKLIEYLQESPQIDVLLVFKLDRLFRNLKDLLNFIDDYLEPQNIALQSVSENFNTQAEGRLFLQLLGSFAEFERKRINERTMAGKLACAKKGSWNGGHVCYGYRKVDGSQYDFDVYPEEAKVVRQIFRLYSRGTGYLKIKKLTGCSLSPQGIAKLISNPFYCGKVRFDDVVSNNNHPAIISERLFKKCQKIRLGKQLTA